MTRANQKGPLDTFCMAVTIFALVFAWGAVLWGSVYGWPVR